MAVQVEQNEAQAITEAAPLSDAVDLLLLEPLDRMQELKDALDAP